MDTSLLAGGTPPSLPLVADVATSERPDWYYVVEDNEEVRALLQNVPGIIVDLQKNRRLVHRNVVATSPYLRVVYENFLPWFAGANPPPADSAVANLYGSKLRTYQREFVDLALRNPGMLNADDVGLGKSLSALTALAGSGFTPVVIVGTLLTRSVWCGPKSEPMKWLGLDVTPLEGRNGAGPEVFKNAPTPWFFVHYDVLEAWLPWIFNYLRPKAIAFDEAHNATPKTKRGRAAESLARFKEIRKRIVLTATPVRNKRIDFWSVLNLVAPDGFGDRHSFGIYFCGGNHGEYGWIYDGETHNEELKKRIAHIMVRRTKAEVMAELPPLSRQAIEIDLEDSSAAEYAKYKAAEHDIRKFLAALGTPLATGISGERLVQLTKMLGILSQGKAETTAELAVEKAKETGKVVVFCWFKDVAKTISKILKSEGVNVYGPVTGEDSIHKRIEKATGFAEDEAPSAFVATLAAASESINQLSVAQQLILNDLYWNPKILIQAEGRLHRGGQKGSVNVTYVLGKGTIDDDLLEVLYRKAEASDTLGLREGSKGLVKTLGVSAPTDDLDAFVSMVEKQIQQGGYGYDDGETS